MSNKTFSLSRYLEKNQDLEHPELTEDCFVTDDELVDFIETNGIINDVHYTIKKQKPSDSVSGDDVLTVEFL